MYTQTRLFNYATADDGNTTVINNFKKKRGKERQWKITQKLFNPIRIIGIVYSHYA